MLQFLKAIREAVSPFSLKLCDGRKLMAKLQNQLIMFMMGFGNISLKCQVI